MRENSYEGILEYIMHVSINDEVFVPHNMPESFWKKVMMSAESGVYASVLCIFATCNITKKPVNNTYTMAQNPGVDRDIQAKWSFQWVRCITQKPWLK